MPQPRPIRPFEIRLYQMLWSLASPLVSLYFGHRGRKDPRYLDHMNERHGEGPVLDGAIWVHATSLGELLSAAPVIRALLDKGHKIVTTHHTPAGREAAEAQFAKDILAGTLIARYVPLENRSALQKFLKTCQPKLCLIMEIDLWPSMVWEAREAGVPVWLCNTQFLTKSFDRDHKKSTFRGRAVQLVSGAMTKSDIHSERFKAAGVKDIVTVGETRFEQSVPKSLQDAALRLRGQIGDRPVIGIMNTVEIEEPIYISALQGFRTMRQKPVFVFVPRAPERFEPVFNALVAINPKTQRRSDILSYDLKLTNDPNFYVLMGNSLCEMYFYLGLCDFVIMGGSFNPRGSHNVVEPLALGKPVIVGPSTWTIEYPVEEAIAAGAVIRVRTPDQLAAEAYIMLDNTAKQKKMSEAAKRFYDTQLGATEKIMQKIDQILGDAE